jgi:hypothetical protein
MLPLDFYADSYAGGSRLPVNTLPMRLHISIPHPFPLESPVPSRFAGDLYGYHHQQDALQSITFSLRAWPRQPPIFL